MLSKTIGTYGGPFVDSDALQDPTSEQGSAEDNRALEDCAQLTITGYRSIVQWVPTAGVPAVGTTTHQSVWGSGSSTKPVVTRTGVGLYTITWAASYTDALSVVESVAFVFGHGSVTTDTADDDNCKVRTIASNVVTVQTMRAGAASDLGSAGLIQVWMR